MTLPTREMAGQNEESLKVSTNPTPNSMPNSTPEHVTLPEQTPKPTPFLQTFFQYGSVQTYMSA
jgi:hypothetical protein